MDRKLAFTAAAAIPVLALIFHVLTRSMTPLLGYALGLCCYWLFLAVLLWRNTSAEERSGWLVARAPGGLLTVLCILPVFVTGMAGMAALETLPMAFLLPIAAGAVVNAVLEEMFWRGAILPQPDSVNAALAVTLFTAWHLALLAAVGVTFTGGPSLLLFGAALLGTIWMAARLRTGTLGVGILSHAGVNLFVFIEFAARNTNFQPVAV